MKFKTLMAAAAVLSLHVASPAQDPARDFTAEAFRSHVTFLADDMLEGREAGTRGYDIAARYVATRLAALGLQTGNGGQWLQPIEFIRYRHKSAPRLHVGGRSYLHGREIVVRPTPSAEAFQVEAPLVFAGYGLDAPGEGLNDYRGLDARGKVVVVLNGYPVGTRSDIGAHLNSEKARMAAAHGAVGMIVVRTSGEAESFPWSRLIQHADRPGTTWVATDGRAFQSSDLKFTATVDRPVAEILFSGAARSLDRTLLEASRQGGKPTGFALSQTIRFESEGSQETRFTSPNVLGLLPGTDPALAQEHVLLMAHLDGLGVSSAEGPAGGDRIRNGAMDNATGVATLLEVARQMSQPGNRPRRPILFAAVTAEEIGLLGAEYLAHQPIGRKVAAVVNLDMPILTYDFSDVTAFGAEHSTLGPIVERAAARMNVKVAPDPLPQEGLFTRSDHYRFVQQGVPSVFLMTGFAGQGRERFTGFLREQYHSPKDDLAQAFNWQAGARFARLNYLIAREIADSPSRPQWVQGSLFGARAQATAMTPAQATAR